MGQNRHLDIRSILYHFAVCLGINLIMAVGTQSAAVSESELRKLDPFAERYNVETLIGKIQSIPFDPDKGFSFVAWGDVRSNRKVFTQLWDSINREPALFSIATGDLVRRGTVDEWLLDFFPIVDRHSMNVFLPVLGNHDIGFERVEYSRIFGVRDYYFDYGNARFIVVDNSGSGFSDEQLDWTENLLRSASNKLTFVFAHKPPKSIEKWAYHSFRQNADEFCSLMTQYNVTHVYLGHIHAYSTTTYQGIDYSITGGGGAGLHNRYGPLGNVHHYVVVRVDKNGITQEVVRLLDAKLVRGKAGNTFYQTPEEMLPKVTLAAVRKEVPVGEIDDFEADGDDYKVEVKVLRNGHDFDIDLRIASNGTVLEIERELAFDEVPQFIRDRSSNRYPGDSFDEAKLVQSDDGNVYEITLEKPNGRNRDFKFSEKGELLKESEELNLNELSETIQNDIEKRYPNCTFEGSSMSKAGDHGVYEVELSGPTGDNIEAQYSLDGKFVK